MQHAWVFEVLEDMKAFADHHGFDALAAQLEDARLTAAAEIPEQELRGGPSCTSSQDASATPPDGKPRRAEVWRGPDVFRYGPHSRN